MSLTDDHSDGFYQGSIALAKRNNLDPRALLQIWFNESQIKASAVGKDSHGNRTSFGVNQITGQNLKDMGTDPEEFITRTAEGQLPEIDRFYAPMKGSQLNTVERLYQSNFLPATLGWNRDLNTVLLFADPSQRTEHVGWLPESKEKFFYDSNRSLDNGNKGFITIGDLKIAATKNKNNPRLVEALARLASVGDLPPPEVIPDTPPTPSPPPPKPPVPQKTPPVVASTASAAKPWIVAVVAAGITALAAYGASNLWKFPADLLRLK